MHLVLHYIVNTFYLTINKYMYARGDRQIKVIQHHVLLRIEQNHCQDTLRIGDSVISLLATE